MKARLAVIQCRLKRINNKYGDSQCSLALTDSRLYVRIGMLPISIRTHVSVYV